MFRGIFEECFASVHKSLQRPFGVRWGELECFWISESNVWNLLQQKDHIIKLAHQELQEHQVFRVLIRFVATTFMSPPPHCCS